MISRYARIGFAYQSPCGLIALTLFTLSAEIGDSSAQIRQTNGSVSQQFQQIAEAIYGISSFYELGGRWNDAVRLLEQGIEIMRLGERSREQAQLQTLLGGIIWKMGYDEEALDMLEEAQRISESLDDKKILSDALYHIGEIYYIAKFLKLEDIGSKALEYHERALKLREEVGDLAGVTHSLSRIGVIHERANHDNQALKYYSQAIELGKEIGYKRGLMRPITHIAAYHRRKGDLEKALEGYQKALAINEEIGNQEGVLFAHGNVGRVTHDLKGDVEEALGHYDKALAISEKIGFKLAIARTLYLMGSLHKSEGNKEKALVYFEKTIESVQDIGYVALIESSKKRIDEIKN